MRCALAIESMFHVHCVLISTVHITGRVWAKDFAFNSMRKHYLVIEIHWRPQFKIQLQTWMCKSGCLNSQELVGNWKYHRVLPRHLPIFPGIAKDTPERFISSLTTQHYQHLLLKVSNSQVKKLRYQTYATYQKLRSGKLERQLNDFLA